MSESHYSKRREEIMHRRRARALRITVIALVSAALLAAGYFIVKKVSAVSRGADPSYADASAVSEAPLFTTAVPETTSAEPTTEADVTAPEISGAADIEIEEGESISYKNGISVTDDRDPAPSLEVDASSVDTSVPGTYTVTYTAADAAGNESSVTVTVTVKAREIGIENRDELDRLARRVVDECTSSDASDVECMYDVFWWVKCNMDFTGHSDKTSWINEGIRGFKEHNGDCFTYFAMLKAMLSVMGYETIDVTRVGGETRHYWMLVKYEGEWYHIDACPRSVDKDKYWYCFLRTDDEVINWSRDNDGYYDFDTSLYPATGTKKLNLGWRQNHPH